MSEIEVKQSEIAPDLPSKWERLDIACTRKDYVGVKFWNPIDANDPALALLSDGVVTFVSGQAFALSTTHLHLATSIRSVDEKGAVLEDAKVIPRKLVLDLAFYGASGVDQERFKAWAMP